MGQKIAGGMKRQRLSQLSPAEQAVAMRHYQMIDKYIAQRSLSKDEYYDVVALGLLLAVKSGLVARTCTSTNFPPSPGRPCGRPSPTKSGSRPAELRLSACMTPSREQMG